jgi:hypothetical protein
MWEGCMEIIDWRLGGRLVVHERVESVMVSIVRWIGRVAVERLWNRSRTITCSHDGPVWCCR